MKCLDPKTELLYYMEDGISLLRSTVTLNTDFLHLLPTTFASLIALKNVSDLPGQHLYHKWLISFLFDTKAWFPHKGNCRFQNTFFLATALSISCLHDKKRTAVHVAAQSKANTSVIFKAIRRTCKHSISQPNCNYAWWVWLTFPYVKMQLWAFS